MSNNKQPLAGLITAKLTPVFLSVGETPILCRGMPPARSPTLTRAGILFSNGEPMTHKMIKSKFLRRAMARELFAARKARGMGHDYFAGIRFGIESGFWAIQRELQ